MSKVIDNLKKSYKKEFQNYEKELLQKHIEDVRDSLDILMDIKGVGSEKGNDDD